MERWLEDDLYALGARAFADFKAELLAHGLPIDPDLELRRAPGLFCYYSLEDGCVYLSVPEWNETSIAIFQMIMGSLFDAEDGPSLLRFLRLFIPRVIAHEIGHHLRHRAGHFDRENLWMEEQAANQLALALTKRCWSLDDRAFAERFLARALASLAAKLGRETIARDSYCNVLESLYAEGALNTGRYLTIRAVGELFDLQPLDIVRAAGVLEEDLVARLWGREGLIQEFNDTYTNDQLTYMYFQMGWMQVDLAARDAGYVEEFARQRLGQPSAVLPPITRERPPTTGQVEACYRAHRLCRELNPVASRYFYKRYRAELLQRLDGAHLGVPVEASRLRRNQDFLLESWESGHEDRLQLLAALVPVELRGLLPASIEASLGDDLAVEDELPTATDQRLFAHVYAGLPDPEAALTLHHLSCLEASPLFRAVPAEVLLELAEALIEVRLRAGEVLAFAGDRASDLFVLLEGDMRWSTRSGEGEVPVGRLFGELSFLADTVRSSTVRAVSPSRGLVLRSADFAVLLHQHPAIMKQLLAVALERLQRLGAADLEV